jgi:hypothetical protein
MLRKPFAEFRGPIADYRIISCVVVRSAAKHIRSDHTFAKHLLSMRPGMFDDVT